MKTKEIIIRIDERSIDSIKKAERKKWKLENQGYTLVRQSTGVNFSELVYK